MDYGDIKGVGMGAVKMIAINMLITCKAKYKLLVMRICCLNLRVHLFFACVYVLGAMNKYRVLNCSPCYCNATLYNQ